MADTTSKLEILVKLKDEATQGMGRLADEMKGLDKGFKDVGWSAGVLASSLAAIAGATMWKAIGAFIESEVQMARFDAMIKTLPASLQQYREELLKAADEAINFGFENETAAVALIRLLQATGNITLTMTAFQAAMDLARFKEIGLEEAARALILAFGGNTRMLKEFGIEVDEHASKETILAAVLQKVRGQAKGYSETTKGAIDTLKSYGGEVLEAIGKSLRFGEAINWVRDKVVAWIKDQGGLNAVLEKYQWLIVIIAGLLAGIFVAGLVVAVAALWPVIGAAVILGAQIGVLTALIAGAAALWIIYWNQIKEGFGIVADWIVGKFVWLKDKFNEYLGWIGDKLKGFIDTLENIGKKITSPIKGAAEKVGGWIENVWPFQHGGIVTRPTLAMIGEAGPEAVIPLNRFGRSGGGTTLNVYLQGDFYTTDEIAEKFGNALAKIIKYNLRI